MTNLHQALDNLDRLSHPDDSVATEDQLSFAQLGLAKPILDALNKAGYSHPTPIQAGAIPPSLAGRDLLLSAQTGSGKTAAFVLPILHRLANTAKLSDKKTKPAIKAVILTPTRELALQVQTSVRTYGERLKGVFSVPLVGGSDYRGQIRALTKGVQIIVATPGRFIDHMNAGRINLDELEVLVLDEADRMLDMGFSEDIDTILQATPDNRQTIMSSATWDGAVGKIAEGFTTNPKRIAIKVESAHIDESVYFCDDFNHKNALLYRLLETGQIKQAVIFAATKLSTERLADDLCQKGYRARYLHGDLPQGKRNRIVADVKAGKCQLLIATDVAARGIDIASISHVINYDLPRQAEDYVHRIGRSGRAGRTGQAISLCSLDDRHLLFAINRYLNRKMRIETLEGLEPKKDFNERPRKDKRKPNKRSGERFKNQRFDDFDNNKPQKSKRPFNKRFEHKPFDKKHFDKKFKTDQTKPSKDKQQAEDRYTHAKVFDDKAFDGKEFDKRSKFDKTSKFDKNDKFGRSDNLNKKSVFGKKSKNSRFELEQPKKNKGVQEFVFNQTAPKRRFGTQD